MSEEKKLPIQWLDNPPNLPEYYANMVHILWSLDDVRFRIGQLTENEGNAVPGPDFRAVAQPKAAVTLSWRNVKLLRNDLINLIDSYEKVNGEINTNVVLAPTTGDKA